MAAARVLSAHRMGMLTEMQRCCVLMMLVLLLLLLLPRTPPHPEIPLPLPPPVMLLLSQAVCDEHAGGDRPSLHGLSGRAAAGPQ